MQLNSYVKSYQLLERNGSLGQHIKRQFVGIAGTVQYLFHPYVDQHLAADGTGLVGTVDSGPFKTDPVDRSLDNTVLFGMQPPAQLMTFSGGHPLGLPQAADVQTVLDPDRHPVAVSPVHEQHPLHAGAEGPLHGAQGQPEQPEGRHHRDQIQAR